ncbi:hypothetical protein TrCOL_g12476 [Triparma columacea]|uniref:Major facilitator superfamily (MFS) profile domain-containing protein n=1 Tax=Triparma columacea TaxID=722753 RepID=A0A9W7FXK4_9STRA|nr:hypothetical protein TrCOL_g12476 [Triparma columacea]
MPKRFYVLASFSIVTCANSWLWITFSPIEESLEGLWGVSAEAINQLSTVFMISYILFAFGGLFVLNQVGLRRGLLLGAGLTCLGSAVRLAGGTTPSAWGYGTTYLGSLIASLGQLFTLAVPPLLATSWFPAGERSLASNVGVVANQCGTAIGLGVTGILVDETNVKDDLWRYFLLQTVFTAIGFTMVWVVVEDSPEVAPSKAARLKSGSGGGGVDSVWREGEGGEGEAEVVKGGGFRVYVATVQQLLMMRDVRLLAIAYGLSTGTFYSVATFLSQLLSEWEASESSFVGLFVVLIGLLGSLTGGYWLDRSRQYQHVTRCFYVFATLAMAFWYFVLATNANSRTLVYLAASLAGFCLTANIGTGFEFVVELTFPVSESTTAGLLNVSAQAFGCIAIWVGEALLDAVGVDALNLMMLLLIGSAAALVCFGVNNKDYLREKEESRGSAIQGSLLRRSTIEKEGLI